MPGFFNGVSTVNPFFTSKPVGTYATALVLAVVHCANLAATTVQPQRDDEVLEVLPLVTRNRPVLSGPAKQAVPDAVAAATAVRKDIAQARQTGDTRYWGRAQSLLAPWWDRVDEDGFDWNAVVPGCARGSVPGTVSPGWLAPALFS